MKEYLLLAVLVLAACAQSETPAVQSGPITKEQVTEILKADSDYQKLVAEYGEGNVNIEPIPVGEDTAKEMYRQFDGIQPAEGWIAHVNKNNEDKGFIYQLDASGNILFKMSTEAYPRVP